jgi:hypothetical protein
VSTSLDSFERRATRRLATTCDAVLIANLSILDTNAEVSAEPLVFFGQTIDVSPNGIGLKIPSVQIDERYCDGKNQLGLSVHLPNAIVKFEVNAVRCLPLDKRDFGEGYVVGTRILRVLQSEDEFFEYLDTLACETESVK